MGFYQWKDELSVNDMMLDRQYKNFLDALDNLHSHIGNAEPFEYYRESITFLGHYIDVHFLEEEDHLAAIGYPHLERQRRQHDFFRARVAALEDACQEPDPRELGKVLVSLGDWLANHIIEADRYYPRFEAGEKARCSVRH